MISVEMVENVKNFWDYMKDKSLLISEKAFAAITTVLGYLSPIKHIAHMMLVFFIIDIYYGWRADRKKNGSKFKPSIVWEKSVPRMTLSIILLVGAFMLDTETNQTLISTYKLVGWFISALLLVSIARNGYIVTEWKVIKQLGILLQGKIKDKTGIDVNEK